MVSTIDRSPSSFLKLWLRVLRAPFFTATIVPILFGTSFAYHQEHYFDLLRFILVLLGGLLVHAGLNTANDFYDYLSGNDQFTKATPVSGGSKVIQEGLVKPRTIFLVSLLCFVAAAAIGLYLNFTLKGNFILLLGIIGVILAYFYAAPPLKIGYRGGIGELVTGIGFGPIMILGAYYAQTQNFTWSALLASTPIGIFIGLVLLINEFPDYEADKKVNKKTLVVLCGYKKSAIIFVVAMTISYLISLILIALRILPLLALMVLITTPLAFSIIKRILRYTNTEQLLPANLRMIQLHLIYGILASIVLFIK